MKKQLRLYVGRRHLRAILLGCRFWLAMLARTLVSAAEKGGVGPIDFVRDIQPLLTKHCVACHGPEKCESGLRLDVRADALRGGDSGQVIHPGKSEESPLAQRIASAEPDERIPPKKL